MTASPNWLFDEPKIAESAVMADENLTMVARLFDNLAESYSGRRTCFIPPTLKDKKKLAEKQDQLRRLLARCQELGVGVEIYLTAQFEELGYVLKKLGIARPPMSQILSSNAIVRFNAYLDRIDKSYVTKRDRMRQNLRRAGDDRLDLYTSSAKRFYTRLEKVQRTQGELTTEVVTRELEMMARVGYVSAYYVFASPLIDDSSSLYLQSVKATIARKLNKDQQAALKRARGSLGLVNEGLTEYV